MKIGLLLIIAALSGCATIQNHPVIASVGTALIVGSIAATIEQHQDGHSQPQSVALNCRQTFACATK